MNREMPEVENSSEQKKLDPVNQEIIKLAQEVGIGEALDKIKEVEKNIKVRMDKFNYLEMLYWRGAPSQPSPNAWEYGFLGHDVPETREMYEKMMRVKEVAKPVLESFMSVLKAGAALENVLRIESRIVGIEGNIRRLTGKMERAGEMKQPEVSEEHRGTVNELYDNLQATWEDREQQQVACAQILEQADFSGYNPSEKPIDYESMRRDFEKELGIK